MHWRRYGRRHAGVALAIAGLGAKDVMGYCLMALIGSGVVISLGLLIF